MPAEDALLFIDSNKYLDLFETHGGRRLLAPLAEQSDRIFVTQQIVDEVRRRKVSVASNFIAQSFCKIDPRIFNLPEHFFDDGWNQGVRHLNDIREMRKRAEIANKARDELITEFLRKVSRSEDNVSKSLAPIFAKAIPHSREELHRAMERRELGNPPGKTSNPVGDQLTWEQVLSNFRGKRRLWVISRDGDYGTTHGKNSFFNSFLYDELNNISPNPEVYLFQETAKGIQHFVESTGVTASNPLTAEEAEEISREERSLRDISDAGENAYQSAARAAIQMASIFNNDPRLKSIAAIAAEAVKVNEETRQVMDMFKRLDFERGSSD